MNLNKSILSRGSQKVPVVCHQYQKPLAVNHDIGRVFIKDLVLGVEKNSVIGLVIAKYEARSFPDKKQPGQLKCQLSFVLRDSVEYFIYVTCWGHDTFVKAISESFKMGDTVEICNFMVQTKANTEIDLKYCPSTPSSYQITVNETHSTVSLFSGDISEFSFLASLPVVDAQDYYALGDIISCPENFNGVSVNLMAAVKDVGATKNILTKAGKHMKRRELKLFDETCVSFPLIIWDSEFAEFADSWQAKETILFLRDVKVAYEEFRQQMVASCTSKTIITTNPDTAEAQHLYSYASTVSFDETFDEMDDDVKLASIVDIYNINDLQDKLLNQENNIWYGILFAVVTSFDIDDDESKCVVTRCSSCQRRLQRSALRCPSQSCNETFRSKTSFEIQLSLSDHTNGQSGYMLVRNVAEKVLQMDVSSFDRLSPAQKTDLKWKFLMERFKVYFKVKPTKKDAAKASITILGMEAVNPVDYIKNSR